MIRNWNRFVGNVLFATLLIALSYYCFDKKVASVVSTVVSSHVQLAVFSATIPDLLFLVVCVITGTAWIAYHAYANRGIYNNNSRFFLLIAYTVPLSFLLKSMLQFLIGRNSARHWLLSPGSGQFHRFHEGGFPSGHMAVFSVVVFAMWLYYPRFRLASGVFLLCLAVALVATDYHFISDVIAGAYLGWVVHYYTLRGLTSFPNHAEGERLYSHE
jgi:membrane-associated phospholipid phosphatase